MLLRLPSKLTPTGLRALVPESGQVYGVPNRAAARDHHPQPLERPDPKALLRGTAMHTLLRRADLSRCGGEDEVLEQADRLVLQGDLSAQERALVWPGPIVAFARSPLGKRAQAAPKVLREYEFSVLLDAAELLQDGPAGEDILLNGAIDLLLFEADGLTVVDFKTDRVRSREELARRAQHYRTQLETYSRALERVMEKPVTRSVLYFLHVGETVEL